jgi:hypothetical protein
MKCENFWQTAGFKKLFFNIPGEFDHFKRYRMKQNRLQKKSKELPVQTRRRQTKRLNKLAFISGLLAAAVLVVFALNYVFSKPSFDGKRSFTYLQTQCEFGPRNPGSGGHRLCGDFLVRELQKYGDKVWEQKFDYRDKMDTSTVYRGRNIIAAFNLAPQKNYRVLLCAHWDTRPVADKDLDPGKRFLPVLGANDGASGVAVLLEIARILKEYPPEFGVDVILFDLEDMGNYNSSAYPDSLNQFCIGSEYFAAHNQNYRPRYGILLDMVGEKNLTIKKEGFSWSNARDIVEKVWSAAEKAGATAFVEEIGEPLHDDHVAFLKRGIKMIDLIDFDYPYWHTTEDTPDKCSSESLQQVGDVLVEVIYCRP